MAEKQTPAKKATTTTRSVGFPRLPLKDAVDIVQKAGKYGHTVSSSALASHAGHKTDNSGPFGLKVAALRDWGLITGSAAGGYALTQLAITIAHPESESARRMALLEAFKNCHLFWNIYEEAAKDVPLERAGLGNRAVSTHKVGAPLKEKFLQSLIASAAFVGLAELVDNSHVKFLRLPEVESDALAEDSGGDADVVTSSITVAPRRSTREPIVHHLWEMDDGEVLFEVSLGRAIPATAWAQIGKVAEEAEKLIELLKPRDDEV